LDAPEVLVTGIAFGESTRWHDGRVWYCDWLAGDVVAASLDGTRETVAHLPAFPFTIDWLPDGSLVVLCGRSLLRQRPDGVLVPYADLTALSDKPWNELVVDGRGNAYVNSVGFDMMAGEAAAPGLIAVVRADGSAQVVAGDLHFPNGMAVTPDNGMLIVAESFAGRLTAFSVERDGRLSSRRPWAEIAGAAPDGICLDADGAVWYADVPNQSCVRVGEHGAVLDRIGLDRGCFACMLGGPDGKTLFLNVQEWRGPEGMTPDVRTGEVLMVRACAASHVGWP
jgi:sugar lactone lactonase YvrE